MRVDDVRAALSAFISRFVIAAHQANEVPMELAACKSELACLTVHDIGMEDEAAGAGLAAEQVQEPLQCTGAQAASHMT